MGNNKFIYPSRFMFARVINWIANSRVVASIRRAIFSHVPFLKLESDVVDIVYLSWVIPASKAMTQVPPGVRVVDRNGQTIVTCLTYRHGHFGPLGLGGIRRICPSPLQSNWRLYVSTLPEDIPTSRTVLFIKNVFSSSIYAVGSRVFSDALPAHAADFFRHESNERGYVTEIRAGSGSSPELRSVVGISEHRDIPVAFKPFFGSWSEAIEFLCLQDAAICSVEGSNYIAQAGIYLPIDPESVVPLALEEVSYGNYLRELGVTDMPFCFAVPAVKFRVLWERLL